MEDMEDMEYIEEMMENVKSRIMEDMEYIEEMMENAKSLMGSFDDLPDRKLIEAHHLCSESCFQARYNMVQVLTQSIQTFIDIEPKEQLAQLVFGSLILSAEMLIILVNKNVHIEHKDKIINIYKTTGDIDHYVINQISNSEKLKEAMSGSYNPGPLMKQIINVTNIVKTVKCGFIFGIYDHLLIFNRVFTLANALAVKDQELYGRILNLMRNIKDFNEGEKEI